MNRDGTNRQILTQRPGIDAEPDWSPDGSRIVFRQSPAGRASGGEIYVMNADGTGQVNLSNRPDAHDYAPDWGP